MGPRTGKTQAREETLKPVSQLVDQDWSPRLRIGLGSVDPMAVVPDVGREPLILRKLAIEQVREQRGLVVDVPPPFLTPHDRRERREGIVFDEIGQPILRAEVGSPWDRIRYVAFHVRLPAKPSRRLFDEVDYRALRQQRWPLIARDVAQLARNRGD